MQGFAREFWEKNYYYCYLKGRLEMARDYNGTDGILVAGSSHSLFGVEENACGDADVFNCSMHSQDIYYDVACIRYVFSDESAYGHYKGVVIVMGYYMPFQDLSLSVNARTGLISRTYYPIFHDPHHWEKLEVYDHFCSMPYVSGEEKTEVERKAVGLSQDHSFFSTGHMERRSVYGFGRRRWTELSEGERKEYASKRAADHARLTKHKDSYPENTAILADVVQTAESHGVPVHAVAAPFTEEYCRAIPESMKTEFRRMMQDAGIRRMTDFNSAEHMGTFISDDFMDTDHLNEKGAEKFSGMLADLF